MKKRAILRGLSGFPQGIAISYVISIIISLCYGTGSYYPCPPSLTALVGSQSGAVLVQAVLCGLIGSFCAASSVIWEIESWSIARQTGTFFILILLFETLVSWLAGWIPNWYSLILNYIIFIVIFILIWGIRCRMWKSRIKKINARLNLDPKD